MGNKPKASITQCTTPTYVLQMQKKPETVDAIFCYLDGKVEGMEGSSSSESDLTDFESSSSSSVS